MGLKIVYLILVHSINLTWPSTHTQGYMMYSQLIWGLGDDPLNAQKLISVLTELGVNDQVDILMSINSDGSSKVSV